MEMKGDLYNGDDSVIFISMQGTSWDHLHLHSTPMKKDNILKVI
jgi:hypothetical protein